MKVVLDANVYLSAFIWGGNPDLVFRRALSGLDEAFATEPILEEVRELLSRSKFHLTESKTAPYLELIREVVQIVEPEHRVAGICRDPDDEEYLSCALEADALFIVSGDKDLLVLKNYENIKILSPAEYLKSTQGN
jgi:putative PIN family toxin of toxin-antitoxin system